MKRRGEGGGSARCWFGTTGGGLKGVCGEKERALPRGKKTGAKTHVSRICRWFPESSTKRCQGRAGPFNSNACRLSRTGTHAGLIKCYFVGNGSPLCSSRTNLENDTARSTTLCMCIAFSHRVDQASSLQHDNINNTTTTTHTT